MNLLLVSFSDWLFARTDAFGPGSGLFGWLHFLLLAFFAAWLICSYLIFTKCKKAEKIIIVSFCIFMICSRTIRMILEISSGSKSFFEAMPWHLCHIMAYVLSIWVLANIKVLRGPIVILSIMGGILTFLFGNYYQFNILTFYDIESIILHVMLPTVGLGLILRKEVSFKFKTFWHMPVFLILLASYAEIGNTIFKDTNFMYIRENGLPFNLFGSANHIYTYLVLLVLLELIIYIPLYIIEKKGKIDNKKLK